MSISKDLSSTLFIYCNKKGLNPIVATSLLLVVAVVAAAAFQQWYENYSSEMLSNVEQSSTMGSSLDIESLSPQGVL